MDHLTSTRDIFDTFDMFDIFDIFAVFPMLGILCYLLSFNLVGRKPFDTVTEPQSPHGQTALLPEFRSALPLSD